MFCNASALISQNRGYPAGAAPDRGVGPMGSPPGNRLLSRSAFMSMNLDGSTTGGMKVGLAGKNGFSLRKGDIGDMGGPPAQGASPASGAPSPTSERPFTGPGRERERQREREFSF